MKVIYREGRVLACPYLIPDKVYEVLDTDIFEGEVLYYIMDENEENIKYNQPTVHESWLFDIVEE